MYIRVPTESLCGYEEKRIIETFVYDTHTTPSLTQLKVKAQRHKIETEGSLRTRDQLQKE